MVSTPVSATAGGTGSAPVRATGICPASRPAASINSPARATNAASRRRDRVMVGESPCYMAHGTGAGTWGSGTRPGARGVSPPAHYTGAGPDLQFATGDCGAAAFDVVCPG